jgi:amidophosphoribosyltransferase
MALGHNGNVINAVPLRKRLEDEWNCMFRTSTDTEVIAYLLANSPGRSWEERVSNAAPSLQGAYSLVFLTTDALVGIRDPLGVRPLCLGRLNGGWIIASESCALDHVGAELVREIEPGEMVVVDKDGARFHRWAGENGRSALCVFELIYFARPDSTIGGKRVYAVREEMGTQLAREHPVEADIVVGVPDSATAAATGYARESGIPFSEGLVKNRYVGRTFIEPDQRLRDIGVRLKFNPLPEVLSGKRVIVVDDSIVRGTTTPHVVSLFRRAGAREVHMRVCAPPIVSPCHFGVDMATQRELLAANHSVEEIREIIGADTLGYLSVPGLLKAVGGSHGGFCHACFTGEYPIPVQLEMDKLAMERA